jgi:hypothetical protein
LIIDELGFVPFSKTNDPVSGTPGLTGSVTTAESELFGHE